MALPTFVNTGTLATGSGHGSRSPGVPASYAANDIFIIFAGYNNGHTAGTPSGYTHVTSSPYTTHSTLKIACFWKRVSASESAPSVTDVRMARIVAVRGVRTTGDPFDVSAVANDASGDTTGNAATLTTTTADNFVVMGSVSDLAGASSTNSAGNLSSYTERADNDDGNDFVMSLRIHTGTLATAGSIGSPTWTYVAPGQEASFTVALCSTGGITTEDADAGTTTQSVTANAPKNGVGAKAQVIG